MSPTGVRVFWTTVASLVNLALAAMLLSATMQPQRLYGEPTASDAIGYGVLSLVPTVNLLALMFARAQGTAARLFTTIVSWANRGGVVLGALFGVASCLERSYSNPEIIVTVLLVVPTSVTAVALWASKRPRGVSSAS